MRTRALLASAAFAFFASEHTAFAYCRTTSAPVNAGYDPTVSGCITQGVALAWPSMPITYQLYEGASAKVPLADATSIVDRAFARWADPVCTAGGSDHPAISFQNLGPTDAADPLCGDMTKCPLSRDAVHAIYFRDDAWPYADSENALALTTVTYGVDTGHIFAAVMEINSHDFAISTALPAPAGSFSLDAIVTHEAGHFLGLAHSTDRDAIMYASYQASDVTLTSDDVAGVCDIYPPGSGQSSSGGCAVGSSPGPGAAIALLPLAVIFLRRARRR